MRYILKYPFVKNVHDMDWNFIKGEGFAEESCEPSPLFRIETCCYAAGASQIQTLALQSKINSTKTVTLEQ